MRPYIHNYGSNHKMIWINDCSVGKDSQNNLPADVSYLQWYYTLAADFADTSAHHKQIYKNVAITGTCTGLDSDPLVQAITIQQKDFGHPVIDGKASVLHGTGFVDHKAFFIIRLAARFAAMQPQYWPRLDLIPGCPALVGQTSRQSIPLRSEI